MIAGSEFGWAARQHRERVAVVFDGRAHSYAAIDRRANRLAQALRGLGLAAGERVAVLLRNCVESVETTIGIAKAGLCIVPLNARNAAPEQGAILADCGARALIAGAEFREVVEAIGALPQGALQVLGVGWPHRGAPDYEAALARASEAEPRVEVAESGMRWLGYTSGTTGRPKGVVMSHAQFHARLRNFFFALEYELGVSQSMVHVGPLTHAAANYLVPYYLRGARNIILPRFDEELLQATIARERVTHLLLVPTMATRFVDAIRPGRHDLSSVSRINYGTAPMSLETLRRGIALFGPVFRGHYGLTEAPQPLTVLYPHEHRPDGTAAEQARLASCGRPVWGVNIVVRGPDGAEVPAGSIGEITVEATGAADTRVWNNPELEAQTRRGGFIHTGDLGQFDADGYLTIVGRNKDMIITGGFNVYAREVEDALHRHPAVLESAVFGIPDREWGESVCAAVVLRAGAVAAPQALIEHCRSLIAGYKKPRHLEIFDDMPRNNAGKIDKNVLRERFLAARGSGAPGGVLASY